mgnify:CR=1 FL=1
MSTKNINSKLTLLLIIYISSYTVCQINDNFQQGILESENSYFIDINDYHNLNLIVTTAQKIYTIDSIPNPISNFSAKVENYSMAATYDLNYILVACLNDSLLTKININTGESTNLLDYSGITIEGGDILVPPTQICSLSIFQNNIVHLAITQTYAKEGYEDILFNKYYIIKLMLTTNGDLGPIIDDTKEKKIFKFPDEYKKSPSIRQLRCDFISNNTANKLMCVYEKFDNNNARNAQVKAATLNDELTQLEGEIKIAGFSYESGFYISRSESSIIKCMVRKMIYNLTLTKNGLKSYKYIPLEDSFLDLISCVNRFGFAGRTGQPINKNNQYYMLIYSDTGNYYKIYDHNALSTLGLVKIYSLYIDTTDTLYCIYISEGNIKYFSMSGITNLFNIQSYSKIYKIISNTNEEYTLENELLVMTENYGTIEIEDTLEIKNANDYNYYNYLVNSVNNEIFPFNKTTKILSTVQTNNYWYTYGFAFVEEGTDYLRIFNLTNINITIETCAFQCGSCTPYFSTCTNCRNDFYAKLNGEENDNNCYPNNQSFSGYIYDSTTKNFEKCYSSCKFCEEKETNDSSTEHKCQVCADGYYPSYQYPKNCYKINEGELTSDKYVSQKSDDAFTLTSSSCSETGKNYKIYSTGECVDSCPTSSYYYSFTYERIDFSEQTNEIIQNNQYKFESISPPKYSFNFICYDECPTNTQPKESTNECGCTKAWHKDTTTNKIECYEEDYCSLSAYKYYITNTKECSNGCPDEYYQFNFQCYKDGCPENTNGDSSDTHKCISQVNYCYINEHFQNVCGDTKPEEYKYKYDGTNQYLKSCSESLVYTVAKAKTYLYDGSCYSQCPSHTEASETEDKCICKFYTYYTDSTKSEYICYEESQICGDKTPLKDINICVNSMDDCINKGYKVFDNDCYNDCSNIDGAEVDEDNANYCSCSLYYFYRDNNNKMICLHSYCANEGFMYSNPDTNECFTSLEVCLSKNLVFFNSFCFENNCPVNTILLSEINDETIKNALIAELSVSDTNLIDKKCVCDINTRNWKVDDTVTEKIDQICTENCDEGYEPDDITHKCVEKCDPSRHFVFNDICYKEGCPEETELDPEDPSSRICKCKKSSYLDDSNNIVCCDEEEGTCPQTPPTTQEITNVVTEEDIDLSNCPEVVYTKRCYPECPVGTCLTQNDANLKTCVNIEPEMVVMRGICIENLPDIISSIKGNKNTINPVSNLRDTSISGYFINNNVYESSQDSNYTLLYLNECEDLLKKEYKLDKSVELFILQIESKEKNKISAINSYNYGVFLENGTQMNMSICDGIKITVSSPIVDPESAHLDKAIYFSEMNYDIYNLSSEFYTYTCAPASIDGNDITLTDRKIDIYPNNVSLCNDSCDYSAVNLSSKRFICDCDITPSEEEEIEETEEEEEGNYIDYFLSLMNYKIVICIGLLKDINNFKSNMGLYFGAGTLIVCSAGIVVFVTSGVYLMRKKIFEGIPTKEKISKKIRESEEIRKRALEDIKNNDKNLINQPPKKDKIDKDDKKKKKKSKKYKDENNDKKKKKSKRKMTTNSNDDNNETQSTIKYKVRTKDSSSTLNREEDNNDNRKIKKKSKFSNNFLTKENLKRRASENDILEFKPKKKSKKKSMGNFAIVTNDYSIKKKKNTVDNNYSHLILNYNDDVEPNQLNDIPFSQALRIDNRNVFKMFLAVFANKIEIISIFYYKDENVHLSLTLSIYIFSLLLDLTLNCFLYTDDVVSEKYHNNGQLEFITSLSLSFMSNIFSGIIVFIIAKLTQFSEFLELIKNEVLDKSHYLINILRFKRITKLKMICFFVIQICFTILMVYYLTIFCIIYHRTQTSILINYLYGVLESFAISFGTAIIISIIRFIAIKYKFRYFYNTSKYIYDKF